MAPTTHLLVACCSCSLCTAPCVLLPLQDYTLISYDVDEWEGKAYAYGVQSLREMGCPVEGLRFDRSLVIRGLIMDTELGNLVKADRFGCGGRRWEGGRWRESKGRGRRSEVVARSAAGLPSTLLVPPLL